jgi:hypothetical protein
MSGTATMYWMQWSRSAGLLSGPFFDDADGGLVRADRDLADVRDAVADLRVQLHRGLRGGLGMELGGEADLEQDVLHHVAAVWPLEAERLTLEERVVEAPCAGGQCRRVAHLARARDEREAHAARSGVTCGPALARAGVGRVPVRAQALAVDPRVGQRVDDLVLRQPEHVRDDGRGGHLHQHDVVEADPIEAVLEGDDTLDLVRLDHRGEDVPHDQRLPARRDGGAREPVGRHEDAAEVVRGMTPLGREPGVVEVEPSHHRAEVERGLHGIELVRRAGHARAVRHHGPRHDGPEQLGARGEHECFETATQRVEQAVVRGLVRLGAVDAIVRDVVRDVGQDRIGLGADVRDGSAHGRSFSGTNARSSGPT